MEPPTHDDPGSAEPSDTEGRAADARLASIEAGRRKGGVAGAAMAGAMLAVGEIFDGPERDKGQVTVDAPGEPGDIDEDGIALSVGEIDVDARPLDRIEPSVDERRRPRL